VTGDNVYGNIGGAAGDFGTESAAQDENTYGNIDIDLKTVNKTQTSSGGDNTSLDQTNARSGNTDSDKPGFDFEEQKPKVESAADEGSLPDVAGNSTASSAAHAETSTAVSATENIYSNC
jgi:hypothetical protein